MLASMLTGKSYSFTVHARDIFVDPQFLQEKLESASTIVVSTHFGARHLSALLNISEKGLSGKVRVIYLGVPVHQFEGLKSQRAESPRSEQPVLLTIARIVPKKGHRYLVDALAELRDRGIGVRWIVAGDGPERDDLIERVREHDLVDRVEFIQNVDSVRVRALLAEADVFVLPSIRARDGDMDGMPVALMEAMAGRSSGHHHADFRNRGACRGWCHRAAG